ncbi:hypothetical protein AWC25_25320 [Mycobacterium sherrisii]|nr:hypothetical protein AWC25_25320 [Mycobacterium sherrisii]
MDSFTSAGPLFCRSFNPLFNELISVPLVEPPPLGPLFVEPVLVGPLFVEPLVVGPLFVELLFAISSANSYR